MRRVAGRLCIICTFVTAIVTVPMLASQPTAEAAPKAAKAKKEPPAEVGVAEQLYAKLAYDDANHVAAAGAGKTRALAR